MEVLQSVWLSVGNILTHPVSTFMAGLIAAEVIRYAADIYRGRKKLAIRVRSGEREGAFGGKSFELLVKNIGSLDLGIHYYGYRTYTGGGKDLENRPVLINQKLRPEDPEESLPFYDGNQGRYLVMPDNILFYFVETGSKVFYCYTCFRPKGWILRKVKRM